MPQSRLGDRDRVDIKKIQARAQFKRRSTANNVEILVPVPEDADSPRFRTNIGSVHYAPEKSAIVWKIKQFGGGKEFLMRAELGLPSVKGDDEHGGGMTGGFGGSMGGAGQGGKGKRPISVKFEIPYFTTSGIQVRYLKIIEPKVSAVAIRALLTICASLPALLSPPPSQEAIGSACVLHPAGGSSWCFLIDLLQWPVIFTFLLILSGHLVARSMGCQPRGSERCGGPFIRPAMS